MSRSCTQDSGLFPLRQRGSTFSDVQDDSRSKVWSTYLEDVGEYDRTMIDTWREDVMGIFMFTGLFSAVVATFLVESSKMLSPNAAGDSPVFHLLQVPRQLVTLTNGTSILPQAYTSPPPASIVWVNTLWLLSFVFNLASALSALLMQQWERSYAELPRIPRSSDERARVRSFLFIGTLEYDIHLPLDVVLTLLHVSVFLFLAGLVLFFSSTNKTVAIVLSISVGLLGVAYLTLTILPCVYRNCPYRTPMTGICWHLWHALAFLAAFCLCWILKGLDALLFTYNLGNANSQKQRKLTEWLSGIENDLNEHRRRLRDGFRKSIVRAALDAPARAREIVDLA